MSILEDCSKTPKGTGRGTLNERITKAIAKQPLALINQQLKRL
jgi:hypothetical protein